MDNESVDLLSAPQTPQRLAFDPTQPSTSSMAKGSNGTHVARPSYPSTPVRPSSRMSVQSVQSSPFRPQAQNLVGPTNERLNQLRESTIVRQSYMQHCMSGYNIPSPQVARATSVYGSNMSQMSHMSHMSHMSETTRLSFGGMSTLSVNTEIANYSWPQNPHQAPHILSKVSGSSVENQDPMKVRRNMTFNEMIYTLKSNESMKQMMALRELIPVVEQQQLEMRLQKPDLKILIHTLFEILIPKELEDEKVVEATLYILYHAVLYPKTSKTCLRIFDSLNCEIMGRKMEDRIGEMDPYESQFAFKHPIGILFIIMYRANQIESRYVCKAWMLLTHLLCNTLFKRRFFAAKTAKPEHQNIRAEVIRFAVESLKKDLKSKPKAFAVSMVRNLSSTNQEIRAMAMQLDVINIFLTIMKEETIHEDLLWSTTQALSAFFVDSVNGEHFIRLGGAQVICGLLSHGSSRLLHELLGCMARIADLPAIQEQNMSEPIHSVVQLLGSFDPTIVERSTAILMNIGLHNKNNKTILVQCGVTNHVFSVLRMSDQYAQLATSPQHSDAIRQQIASIYEHCLSVLNNVTLMSQQDNRETAVEACKMICMNVDSATTLLNFICIGKRYCRKLAITVLKRVIETVPAYADRFVDLYATTNEQLPMLLLKRIWESLKQWRSITKEVMQSINNDEATQRRKDHEDIVRRSAGLLSTLCLESNPRFMEAVLNAMLNSGANPFLFLSHEISDPMLFEWLNFIWNICKTEQNLNQKLLLRLMTSANVIGSPFLQELHERRPHAQIRQIIGSMMQLAGQQHASQ